jgi:hypothetical protein
MAKEEGFFDDLARGLADGTITRGKALRLMGAAVVGGTLGSLGIGEAAAAPGGCKSNGKHCKRDTQCCSLNCASGTCQATPAPQVLLTCTCENTSGDTFKEVYGCEPDFQTCEANSAASCDYLCTHLSPNSHAVSSDCASPCVQ